MSVAVLAAGTGAYAQSAGGITNIVGDAASSATLNRNADPATFGPGAGTTAGGPPGASFNSFVNVTPQQITFESANTSAAPYASTSSFSTVSFDVNNNTGHAATFNSTITAAGLGFYMADTSGGCLYSCPQVAAGAYSFADLAGTNGGADVGFNFTISRASTFGNEATVLYSLSGSLSMNHDGTPIFLNSDLEGPQSLDNFRATVGNDLNDHNGNINNTSGIGYAWDATDISFDIGDLTNQTLIYSTSVFSTSSLPCVANTNICLVAYSGFGDPVGRGGGVENLTAGDFRSLGLFSRLGGGPLNAGSNRIGGLNFTPTVLDTPTFDNGVVTLRTSDGIPEPTAWTMMIAGFGLLGAALRRRRVLAYN